MLRTPLDILDLFVRPPGDLLFFLLVIAFSQGAVFLAFGNRSRFPFEYATRRYVFATVSLVVIWLVMLGGAALSQYADLDPAQFMPPLERLAFATSLLILAWAFLSADFIRWRNRSNVVLFGLTFVLALLFINTARSWLRSFGGEVSFNATDDANIWSAVTVAIAAIALLIAIANYGQTIDAPLKVVFFAVFLLGNGWDLLRLVNEGAPGNTLGGARLAYLAGLILLPLVLYRLSIALLENSLVEVVLAASQQASALAAASTGGEATPTPRPVEALPAAQDKGRLLHAISKMLDGQAGASAPDRIVGAVIDTLGVDICLLLKVEENDYADVAAGFDQVSERAFSGISLNLSEQPTLLEAARLGEGAVLFADYHEAELEDLCRRLTLSPPSDIYAQPVTVEGELHAILVVSLPYQQAQLPPEELETLRELSVVAAGLLAWPDAASDELDAAAVTAFESADEHDAAGESDATAVAARRNALLASLRRVHERSGGLQRQMLNLRGELEAQQAQLLDSLGETTEGQAAAPKLASAFKRQAQLRASSVASARQLLEAETVLGALRADGAEDLALILRDLMQKQHALDLNTRDRLRRALNDVLAWNRAESSGISAILQSFTEEAAQLKREQEQHKKRRETIAAELSALGVTDGYSSAIQLLIQLTAERDSYSRRLTDLRRERARLQKERADLMATGRGEDEELARKLRHLSAEHEHLLELREEMRRENQDREAQLKSAAEQGSELQRQNEALQAELQVGRERENAISERHRQQISELEAERDNLLALRDQLTARIATFVENEGSTADPELEAKLLALQSTVERLTDQREQLALELSDVKSELIGDESREAGDALVEDETDATRASASQLYLDVLRDLGAPLKSISDYTDLLLEESLGILGAAQAQVLRLVAADIEVLVTRLAALQDLAEHDPRANMLAAGSSDLARVIESAVGELAPEIAGKGIVVELSLEDKLPALATDAAGLKPILEQLLRNASFVSPPGSTIRLIARSGQVRPPEAAEATNALEILVSDQGGGIAPADMERVFARRYRAENPALAGLRETGVGLTVARAFVRSLDGDLWVQSRPGEGSTFHLAVPLQLAPSIED